MKCFMSIAALVLGSLAFVRAIPVAQVDAQTESMTTVAAANAEAMAATPQKMQDHASPILPGQISGREVDESQRGLPPNALCFAHNMCDSGTCFFGICT